jgi:predicted transcriptional regulator
MNLEKLFGSKTKGDILKYLVFRRQWVSMRALEAELGWTFPAIKKQVDVLEEADIIEVDKDKSKRSITMKSDIYDTMRQLFLFALKRDLANLLDQHSFVVQQYYLGKVFGYDIETDIVIIYQNCEKEILDNFKMDINNVFRTYGIETVYVTLLSAGDRQKRLQLADRFVLWVLRTHSK